MDLIRSARFTADADTVFAAVRRVGQQLRYDVMSEDPLAGTIDFLTRFSWASLNNDRVIVTVGEEPEGSIVVVKVRRHLIGPNVAIVWAQAGRVAKRFLAALDTTLDEAKR